MSGFAPEGDDATIIVADPRWRGVVRGIEPLLRRVARAAGGGETAPTIVLDDDRAVRTLNHRHRDRNKPTNVLTFMPIAPGHGGDIVLARGVVQREARAMGRPVRDHLVHLVVHGILHLAGHDHHEVGEARRMEMAEAWILGRLGVPNPWKSAARGRDL
ncbi:hypothetical protein AA103196_2391 [Ameyamaea chiangmaiensis NBRC 103196]|uniref:Endoribonuclease YbeY n=2 Tax=Ameyamaea chiangmaiensis TaxID=442969 RepID=A0A850PFG2_9PROT|nr:rRNA maturation RNase YbeY [Ameyamaea chiangmaiensis]NVN41190.1 rRNA maturation RNase YbeY [Ameyamaea chiangmaiensis]GBQ70072.1 hypothetical protein AA103196_2391 [Ameyamaea chiangmaiensis NBRC 103196]